MFSEFFTKSPPVKEHQHKEGELYKRVIIHGRLFSLYYGYYEECDRLNPMVPPVPIYPDFLKEPLYTTDGFAYVTMMQDVCDHFSGPKDPDSGCSECIHFRRCEELFGICTCFEKRLRSGAS